MTLRHIARGADRILSALEAVLLIALLVLSVAVLIADIALRVFANVALPWAAEATRYAIVWMVFIGGSPAARKGAHISIDALTETLPARHGLRLVRATLLASAAGCAVLAWYGWQLVRQMMMFHQRSPSLEWPMWMVYLALPIGFALMALRFAQVAASPPSAADRAALMS
ncbi:TRAP transporter small permease [Falsirhodobacter algicola]|uniref:TRAP transporter small permease protein n=1 Tax=Falsirhodobacter algicola TaxID=2692330 RepID=A0A8J8MTR0_9RHOB|nr:TRAP transporter small permease [Falsirhodobacter algicola]QUS36309.1 TRAP transporter small permease subunit [Falsirhodobacter algicola]